jgi:hypothetical protein
VARSTPNPALVAKYEEFGRETDEHIAIYNSDHRPRRDRTT